MTNRSNDQQGPNMYALGALSGRRIYGFRCAVCGASGKIAVPADYRHFDCPNNAMSDGSGPCPAKYIQWQPPEALRQGGWALRCVNGVDAATAVELRAVNRRVNRHLNGSGIDANLVPVIKTH